MCCDEFDDFNPLLALAVLDMVFYAEESDEESTEYQEDEPDDLEDDWFPGEDDWFL